VKNLLSERIVTASGAPGPNVAKAIQRTATDTTTYQVDPRDTATYGTLPQPHTTSVPQACSGQSQNVPDARFPAKLPNAPYQLTKYVPYYDSHGDYSQYGTCQYNGAYVGDPIHRFYQMYQQVSDNKNDLWTWVHGTAGGLKRRSATEPVHRPVDSPGCGRHGLLQHGDGRCSGFELLGATLLDVRQLPSARDGGTSANHIMLGTGDAAFYQDAHGNATTPPSGEIENPNPQPGTNNFYTQDGYGKAGTTDGGSYSDCSNHAAPGVSGAFDYLDGLSYKTYRNGDCARGHFYLLNNYHPGYNVDASLNTAPFTVPPQHSLPTIGDALSGRRISWGYFGEGYDNGKPGPEYCDICDPMAYSSAIMTNPKLWKNTAIFVTFDEGGGYYDSGYVQPVSFFGDGSRVPMIVVSPYAKPGYISHTYTDHVSILKFIERNWRLSALSGRSLDNLPNPISRTSDPYVPTNRPAIGDMFDYFNFKRAEAAAAAPPRGRGGARVAAKLAQTAELRRRRTSAHGVPDRRGGDRRGDRAEQRQRPRGREARGGRRLGA
jgi:phospholipase C